MEPQRLILLLLVGCNQGALAPTAPDLSIGNFCSGGARVELNGMEADSPAVSGRLMFLDCCDAAEFDVVSMQIAQPIFFAWRHMVGAMPTPPTTLDLTNLPTGWGATLYSGCSPAAPGCTPTDILTNGFSGTLTVGDAIPSGGYTMSVCLNASTSAHPVLRSVRLWSQTVVAR
jgi:hypothetical protein